MPDDAPSDESEDAGIVDRLRARFDRSTSEEPTSKNDEEGGFLSGVRSRFGFGDEEPSQPEAEPPREEPGPGEEEPATSQEQPTAPEPPTPPTAQPTDGSRPSGREALMERLQERIGPEREAGQAEANNPGHGSPVPGPLAFSVDDPDATAPETQAPTPASRGSPVPAKPEPQAAGAEGGDPSREPARSAPPDRKTQAPAPPAGGDPIPGHPDLGGRPAPRPDPDPGFEAIDVPDPDVLHERVDDVLDRYARSSKEGSR